ncbi:MAG: hypothetical protein VX223_06970, partial [Myxococcota bacterium]|nr:hypothetical protein [Myxococcota bacterium]
QMSPRMAASLTEVDETTTSWPQLASDVALGGALVCHAARKIVLGQALSSGRYYIDLNEQLRQPHPVHVPVPYKPHPDAMEPRALPELTVGPQRTLTRELLETWMAWGTSAPSPHNHQGWAFCFESGELHCAIDESRVYTGLDTEATASILAVGCAVENIVLAAQATGFSTAVRETGTTPRVATLTFTPSSPQREYIEEMRTRITNRRTTAPAPISADAATALQHVAITGQCELHLLTDQNKLKVLAELARQAGRLMFLQPQAYSEIVDGIRIGAKEVALGDGIDVETMDSTAKDIAALSLIRHAPVGAALREIGLGSALGNAERDAFLTASAAGLLILPGDDTPNAFFRGGRVFQRVWLEATRLGLAIHPVSNLPWMFRRVDRMQGRGFSPEAREFLRTVRPTFDSLFPASKGARLGLLRISSASRPAARTLRRPLSDVFVWSGDDG